MSEVLCSSCLLSSSFVQTLGITFCKTYTENACCTPALDAENEEMFTNLLSESNKHSRTHAYVHTHTPAYTYKNRHTRTHMHAHTQACTHTRMLGIGYKCSVVDSPVAHTQHPGCYQSQRPTLTCPGLEL